ncbi:unnamed protein product [Sphagnum troendelagicum]|uniref:Uncharacterized protein n=1 Tax=Sphagnum troendelagicum TaxID=128251 RepID=A0ABP0TQP2_9BRYO
MFSRINRNLKQTSAPAPPEQQYCSNSRYLKQNLAFCILVLQPLEQAKTQTQGDEALVSIAHESDIRQTCCGNQLAKTKGMA